MPELPEVHTIVSQLAPVLRGEVIESAKVHRAEVIQHGRRQLKSGLTGMRIREVIREGKRIVIRIEPNAQLVVHLGMTGRLVIHQDTDPIAKHTHLRLRLRDSGQELRFVDPRRFGGIWFAADSGDGASNHLRELGPDALSISAPVLRRILDRNRQIKGLLLDQQLIAGLGNIYTDEALFLARIHPQTRSCLIPKPQVRALAQGIRKTLRASINSGGSTLSDYRDATGEEGTFQRLLKVYGRTGDPCRRCKTPIERILVSGRATHFCPECQVEG